MAFTLIGYFGSKVTFTLTAAVVRVAYLLVDSLWLDKVGSLISIPISQIQCQFYNDACFFFFHSFLCRTKAHIIVQQKSQVQCLHMLFATQATFTRFSPLKCSDHNVKIHHLEVFLLVSFDALDKKARHWKVNQLVVYYYAYTHALRKVLWTDHLIVLSDRNLFDVGVCSPFGLMVTHARPATWPALCQS